MTTGAGGGVAHDPVAAVAGVRMIGGKAGCF